MIYAVLVEVDVAAVDEQQGLSGLREQIVPAISSMPGFRSGTWLTGNDDGKGLSLTLWDTEEQAKAMAGRFQVGSNPQLGAEIARCEVRTVAATA